MKVMQDGVLVSVEQRHNAANPSSADVAAACDDALVEHVAEHWAEAEQEGCTCIWCEALRAHLRASEDREAGEASEVREG